MAISSHAAPSGRIEAYDPIWQAVRSEAEEVMATERALGGFVYATILSHERLEDAICHRLAQRADIARDKPHCRQQEQPAEQQRRGDRCAIGF